jgi:DtxR family Mn-dependent transcriptional regulator
MPKIKLENTESTSSTQDYLKTIYALTSGGELATTTALAARLGVAPASVTGMVQKMAASQPPLVNYKKHQGVSLTPAGEQEALKVIRSHRLLETYLVSALGYTWDSVHEEADRLEHAISPEFEARLADLLGNPSRDPHGEPIPAADLSMPDTAEQPLSELRPGQRAAIRRVNAAPELLRHVQALDLLPGVTLTVREVSAFDQNLSIEIAGSPPLWLGLAVTSQIFVEVL